MKNDFVLIKMSLPFKLIDFIQDTNSDDQLTWKNDFVLIETHIYPMSYCQCIATEVSSEHMCMLAIPMCLFFMSNKEVKCNIMKLFFNV
jgi:hypothetical protein